MIHRNLIIVFVIAGLSRVFSAPSYAKATKAKNSAAPCLGVSFPHRTPALRLNPGEELSYEVSALGLYIGKLDLKIGKIQRHAGQEVITLFGRARTASFASQFEKFVGRSMSLVDTKTFRPVALRVRSQYGDDIRRETVRFQAKQKGLNTSFRYRQKQGSRRYDKRSAPILDLLTAIHYARLLEIPKNGRSCQEIYLDRRVWRMDARFRGIETIDTIAGSRKVLAIEAKLDRVPHPDFDPKRPRPWLKGVFYYADDADRTLLAFELENRFAKGKGQLTRWSKRGKTDDSAWTF